MPTGKYYRKTSSGRHAENIFDSFLSCHTTLEGVGQHTNQYMPLEIGRCRSAHEPIHAGGDWERCLSAYKPIHAVEDGRRMIAHGSQLGTQ